MPVGPPPEMRISREDLLKEMEAHGVRLTSEHTFLPYQYFLIFKPQETPAAEQKPQQN